MGPRFHTAWGSGGWNRSGGEEDLMPGLKTMALMAFTRQHVREASVENETVQKEHQLKQQQPGFPRENKLAGQRTG